MKDDSHKKPLKTKPDSDIEDALGDVARIRQYYRDPEEAEHFAKDKTQNIINLLEELKDWRREQRESGQGDYRIILEGFSDESMQEAFRDAMSKAASYFSQEHDVNLTVLGLVELPKGGYHATVEVHITPMKQRLTEKPESEDLERKHINNKDYQRRKKEHEDKLKHLIHDHFLTESGEIHDIPDYHLVNVDNIETLRMMMEQNFFHATHDPDTNPAHIHNWADDAKREFMIRFKRNNGPKHDLDD